MNELGRPQGSRRRLLLIYIHGFNGTDNTFQDLPVHIHSALTELLAESHVVCTRKYPSYKSQGEFQLAVTQFSEWLSQYEADDQDMILLGHSMGGLIAADTALLHQGVNPKHRIFGLVNFDSPFLGIHPHAVSTGFGSLFQKNETPDLDLSDQADAIGFETVYNDPNFNPMEMPNHPLNLRQNENLPSSEVGLIEGMKRFMKERAEEKRKERSCHGKSALGGLLGPVKFVSSVNNYAALRRRYQRLKELDNTEDEREKIRFVNYYTYSTGRPKIKEGNTKTNISRTSGNRDTLPAHDSTTSLNSGESCESQAIKMRKFVLLPSAHWKDDSDSNWLPITMDGMNEAEAHQSMFIPGASYDYLVGDSVALIEQWVQNDLTRRLLQSIT